MSLDSALGLWRRTEGDGRSWEVMLEEDFTIQSNIRRILVRSNIDYSQIIFGTVKGVVYMRGLFKMARDYSGEGESIKDFTAKTLHTMEKRIKSIPGVMDVIFQLENWKKEKGQWVPKKEIG
jgi:hypothetical protein